MRIHKEGKTILMVLMLVLLVINASILYFVPQPFWLSRISILVSVVVYILVLQFFRNPKVDPPQEEGLVLAPADGKVVVIEKTIETEYLQDDRIQISIFMSPFNVHVNRSPVAGVVRKVVYHAGKYLVAWHPKSSTENERTTLVVETKKGVQVLFRQIAGAVARRIRWYIEEGEELKQGQEFGFIKFGSRVDVFLPLDAKIEVKEGQITKGGRTVLARLD